MALFGKKQTEDTKADALAPVAKKPTVNNARSTDRDLSGVLVKPYITEKSVGQSTKNVYTFEVSPRASKFDVRDAVKLAYGVTPVRVNIVKKATRKTHSRTRGRMVTEKGMKKAYVYLKKGDSISIV